MTHSETILRKIFSKMLPGMELSVEEAVLWEEHPRRSLLEESVIVLSGVPATETVDQMVDRVSRDDGIVYRKDDVQGHFVFRRPDLSGPRFSVPE